MRHLDKEECKNNDKKSINVIFSIIFGMTMEIFFIPIVYINLEHLIEKIQGPYNENHLITCKL